MKDMMEAFAKYAKEQFGCDISLKTSSTPDTFESIFGASFIKQNDDDIFFCEGMENSISYKNIVARVNVVETVYREEIDLQQDLVLAA